MCVYIEIQLNKTQKTHNYINTYKLMCTHNKCKKCLYIFNNVEMLMYKSGYIYTYLFENNFYM